VIILNNEAYADRSTTELDDKIRETETKAEILSTVLEEAINPGFAVELGTKPKSFFCEKRKKTRSLDCNQVEFGGGERIRTAASRPKH
jgi:hypothetical protein